MSAAGPRPNVQQHIASPRALLSFRFGRRTIYFLPLRGVVYGAISLAIVLVSLLALDRLVLPSLERRGWIPGQQWQRHNRLIEINHRLKTTAKECEPRQWNGEPLVLDRASHKILVMGDSFVWGPPYITLNHLWWRQLAIELERRGYHDVQVLAVGQPGWSTHQQLDCARQHIPELKPDLVIWGYVTNDPDEKVVRQIQDLQDRPIYGDRLRRLFGNQLPNLAFHFESFRANKLAARYAGPVYGYAYYDWELELLKGENLDRYRQTVQEVGSFMREMNTPACLLTLPTLPCREHYEPRYEPVLKEWTAAGIVVKNALDEFVARYGNIPPNGPEALAWGINPSDAHPGPKATHFHAVMAADLIEQSWPEVLGTRDSSRPHELAINDWLPFDLNPQKNGGGMFVFSYPATTELMPTLPLDEPTALVALRVPLLLDSIRLDGDGIKNVAMWASFLHPDDPYDETHWHALLRADESDNRFVLPAQFAGRNVAEIRFRADFPRNNRHVTLILTPIWKNDERP